MTAKPGDFVLYHFETRNGLTERPALVVAPSGTRTARGRDDQFELLVFPGSDIDVRNDLGDVAVPDVIASHDNVPRAGFYTVRGEE